MKKIVVLSILIIGLLTSSFVIPAYADNVNKEERVTSFVKEFLDETFQTPYHRDYQEIYDKYLLPGNDLFNEEVKIRLEIGSGVAKDFAAQKMELTSDGHTYNKVEIVKGKAEGGYRAYINLSENVSAGGNFMYNVAVDMEEIDGKLYITNLYSPEDGLSDALNKAYIPEKSKMLSVDEMKLEKNLTNKAEYLNDDFEDGISEQTFEDKVSNKTTKQFANKEEVETARKSNLENLRIKFTQQTTIDLNQDPIPDKEIEKVRAADGSVNLSRGVYNLNYQAAGDWARTYAKVDPNQYRAATNYRFVHLEDNIYQSNDCANFASQVVHAGGAPMRVRTWPAGWFANNQGRTRSTAWSYAKDLKTFVIQNRQEGPFVWRSTTMNYNNAADNTLYPGDLVFLQHSSTGNAYHTLAVSSAGGRNRALYCAHTTATRSELLSAAIARNRTKTFYGANLQYRR